MIKHFSKTREKRKARTRSKMHGTNKRPRLAVFRSHTALYVQFVDDDAQVTLLGLSDKNAQIQEKNKVKKAYALGKLLAEEAKKKKITTIIFDRSGYTYHGRLKSLADGLREGGLVF